MLQIDKFWTQMILAGNQSKQRGPPTYLLGVRQGQSFPVKYVSFCMIVIQTLVLVLVAISRPDNMQLHELILTPILIAIV